MGDFGLLALLPWLGINVARFTVVAMHHSRTL
jgi:hypothetical protein